MKQGKSQHPSGSCKRFSPSNVHNVSSCHIHWQEPGKSRCFYIESYRDVAENYANGTFNELEFNP
jgi:hypothetical protein